MFKVDYEMLLKAMDDGSKLITKCCTKLMTFTQTNTFPIPYNLNVIWSCYIFPSVLNPAEFNLVPKQKGGNQHDHISYNLKGNENLFPGVLINLNKSAEKKNNVSVWPEWKNNSEKNV